MPKQINKHYQTLKDAGYTLETRPGSEGYNQLYAIKGGEEMAGVEYHSEAEGQDLKHAQAGLRQDEAMNFLCEDLDLEVAMEREDLISVLGPDNSNLIDLIDQGEALMQNAQHVPTETNLTFAESKVGFSFPDNPEPGSEFISVQAYELDENGDRGANLDSAISFKPEEGKSNLALASEECAQFINDEISMGDVEAFKAELLNSEDRQRAHYEVISEEAGIGFSIPDANREQLGGAMTYQIGIHELTEDGELGPEMDVMSRHTPEEGMVYPDAIRACAEKVTERLAEQNQEMGQDQDLEEPLELRFSKDSLTKNGNPRYDYSLRIDDNEYQGKYVGYDPKGQMKEQAMQDHPSIAGEIQNAVVKHDDLKKYGAENFQGNEEDRPQDTDISVSMRRAEDRSHTASGVPRWEYTAEFQGDKVSGKANGYEGPDIDNTIANKLQKDWPEAMDKAEGITLKEDKVNVHKPEKASKKEQEKEEGMAI